MGIFPDDEFSKKLFAEYEEQRRERRRMLSIIVSKYKTKKYRDGFRVPNKEAYIYETGTASYDIHDIIQSVLDKEYRIDELSQMITDVVDKYGVEWRAKEYPLERGRLDSKGDFYTFSSIYKKIEEVERRKEEEYWRNNNQYMIE